MAGEAEPQKDYLGSVAALLKDMRYKERRYEDSGFSPNYSYNNSSLKNKFDALSSLDVLQVPTDPGKLPGVPAAIRDQVTKLGDTCRDAVQKIISGDFKQENWDAPFKAIEQSIAAAKAKDAAQKDPGQDDAALDKLGEQIKSMQTQALDSELKKMHANLNLQNEMNFQMARVKQQQEDQLGSDFYTNDWRNETNPNDLYTDKEMERFKDAGAVLTTGAQLHNGADGVYSKPNSKYKVEKRTDEKGNAHYSATYSHVPKGDLQTTAEALLDTAVLCIKIWSAATIVLPILAFAVIGLARLGCSLMNDKITPPENSKFNLFTLQSVFEKREGTTRDEVKAEIDLARNRGKESDMYMDLSRSEGKQINIYDLEKTVIYLDEMKKRAGYTVGPNGPEIKNHKSAMGFQTDITFETKLRALEATQKMTPETEKMVESFYKSQHGSMKGYDPAQFKEYIFREIINYRTAIADMERKFGKDIDNRPANTSTITPGGDTNTSTISPTKGGDFTSVISPSKEAAPMPSAPPAQLSAQDQMARAFAVANLVNGASSKVTEGNNFQETVKNAVEKYAGLDDLDATFKTNLDDALGKLTEGEKQEMEQEGTLEIYREATVRMHGEPAPGFEKPPAYEASAPPKEESIGTIAAAKKTTLTKIEFDKSESGVDFQPEQTTSSIKRGPN
ncbi:MAG: hypothetical protein V4501_12715 [Pseudomonadota bacterium]